MQAIRRLVSAYRDELKGFAILWVIFSHARLGLGGWLYDVQKIGYGGVDIFLFLSGFGLYHSLECGADLRGYLGRRAQRLLPAYVPFCLLWLLVMLPLSGLGLTGMIRTALGNLFMVGFFSDAPLNINWYVSALAASLLIAPMLHAVLHQGKGFGKRAFLLLFAAFAFGLAFVGKESYMAVSRLPIFILGMVLAGWKSEKPGKGILSVCLIAAAAFGLAVLLVCYNRFPELLLDYAMYWHPFVLITPGLCLGLSWLFSFCPSKALAPLRLLGKASFELFLFNAWVELAGKHYGLCQTPSDWVLWSLLGIAAGLLYHLVIDGAAKKISQKR